MNSKEKLYTFCSSYVEGVTQRIQASIEGIQESLVSETKSSAGDKHETGRAMQQLEREKLGQQLAEVEKMSQILQKVSTENTSETVVLGSLVRTKKVNYYIAISAGVFKDNSETTYCISMATPIGQLLFGKREGDTVIFNGTELYIQEII
jgi:transcription elongation GreA/GreB family factor